MRPGTVRAKACRDRGVVLKKLSETIVILARFMLQDNNWLGVYYLTAADESLVIITESLYNKAVVNRMIRSLVAECHISGAGYVYSAFFRVLNACL